jgi:hypothetical protein
MSLRRKRREHIEEPPARTDQSGSSGLAALLRLIGRVILGPPQRRLSYEETIGWFVDHRPPNNAAAHGAVLRTAQSDGRTEIVQLFLDAEGKPLCTDDGALYGRRFVVDELGQELTERFGGTRLLMVH